MFTRWAKLRPPLSASSSLKRALAPRRHASRLRISIPPPFPTVDTCPSPTCSCRPMPQGLDIDRASPLNGTMAAYAEQALISTGRDDWSSRIEDDEDAVLARGLKDLLGRNGKLSNPYHNVMITHSSFVPSGVGKGGQTASAYVLPSFRYVPEIPLTAEGIEAFTRAFILPTKLHLAHDVLPPEKRKELLRAIALQQQFQGVQDVREVIVQICGHAGRDARCGVMGPLLRSEFEDKLRMKGFDVKVEAPLSNEHEDSPAARVGLTSHIGGHKYAGNVIIYIPPSMRENPLAGKGVWYGRMGPEHVEGIVQQTICEGKVVKGMFRGGIQQGGEILRL